MSQRITRSRSRMRASLDASQSEEQRQQPQQLQEPPQEQKQASSTDMPMENTPPRPAAPTSRLSIGATPRVSRVEEKEELQELNKRLEMYILKQRERDASQEGFLREIDVLKTQYQKELRTQKDLYERQLEAVRKNRDEEAGKVTELEALLAERDREVENLRISLENETKARNNLEFRLTETTRALSDAATRASLFENRVKSLEKDNAILQSRTANTDQAFAEISKRAEEATARATQAEAKYADISLDYEHYKASADEEIRTLKEELHEVSQAAGRDESQIRRDFELRLQQLIAERQMQYEQEKEELVSELRTNYDQKIIGYRNSLERAGHELEAERDAKGQLASALAREHSMLEDARTLLRQYQQQLKEINETIQQEKDRIHPMIQKKNAIIKQIKEAFRRKDEEFDDLMDVKIMLDMEIKAYRRMLEEEEERLGYKSPLKKRKREFTLVPASSSSSATIITDSVSNEYSEYAETKSTATPSFLISGRDLDGHWVTIRNNTTEQRSLAGFSLRSKETGKSFVFPESANLRPGESYTVHTIIGKSASKKPKPVFSGQNEYWPSSTAIWSEAGDEVLLLDPHDNLIGQVSVLPVDPVEDLSTRMANAAREDGMDSTATGEENKNCIIQ